MIASIYAGHEPEFLTGWAALDTYLVALAQMLTPRFQVSVDDGSPSSTLKGPWPAEASILGIDELEFANDGTTYKVRIREVRPGADPRPFWRKDAILRLIGAMNTNLNGEKPLDQWPKPVKCGWKVVSGYPSKEMSVGEVAKCLGLSASYFGERFEHIIGTSFRTLLRDERLSHAGCLLEGTYLTISEIAGKLGGQSVSQFNRNFATAIGMTPSEWRTRFSGLETSPECEADQQSDSMQRAAEG